MPWLFGTIKAIGWMQTGIINHGEQVIRIDLLIEKSSTKDCCQLFQENGIISI